MKKPWVRFFLHSFGLSCLGGCVFLQCLTFYDIIYHGFFYAVEHNPTILTLEIVLTICAVVYFVFLFKRFLTSIGRKPS